MMSLRHAQHKDLAALERAIENGAPVDARDEQGYTALIWVCGMSHGIKPSLQAATYLISRGADVNAKAARGFTPLTEACAYGAADVVELLLESGADPNLKGEQDIPALTFAATCAHWSDRASEIVRLLLEKGANVDARDEYGYTALLKLLSQNQYQRGVAKLLIEAGADLDYQGPYESTAARSAAEKGDLDLLELLVDRGAAVDLDDEKNPLISAMRHDHKDVVVYLLEASARESLAGALSARSLLAYAGEYGHTDLLRFLDLEEVAGEAANEALLEAAENGHLEFIKALVQRGVHLDLKSEGGAGPLMQAARYGHLAVAEYLLQNNASVQARDGRGNTPLLFAAYEGQLEMIQFLLKSGAAIDAKNALGWTALFQACAKGHDRCVRSLIQRGADINTIENENGATPLIVAASEGRLEAVRLLLDAGALIDIHAANGRTALTWANGNAHDRIVEALMDAGATLPTLPGAATGSVCAYCSSPLSTGQFERNHCSPCDRSYCDTHYPWSDWDHDHVTSDEMCRSAMCPQGHLGTEYGRG